MLLLRLLFHSLIALQTVNSTTSPSAYYEIRQQHKSFPCALGVRKEFTVPRTESNQTNAKQILAPGRWTRSTQPQLWRWPQDSEFPSNCKPTPYPGKSHTATGLLPPLGGWLSLSFPGLANISFNCCFSFSPVLLSGRERFQKKHQWCSTRFLFIFRPCLVHPKIQKVFKIPCHIESCGTYMKY